VADNSKNCTKQFLLTLDKKKKSDLSGSAKTIKKLLWLSVSQESESESIGYSIAKSSLSGIACHVMYFYIVTSFVAVSLLYFSSISILTRMCSGCLFT